MKRVFSLMRLALLTSLALAGCSKKGMNTAELEKAFQSIPASAPNQAAAQDPVRQTVNEALTAIKKEDFVEGTVALQSLRSSPTLNPDQLTAVQDAMAALQKQLAERADRGDVKARQALEAIRTMRRR